MLQFFCSEYTAFCFETCSQLFVQILQGIIRFDPSTIAQKLPFNYRWNYLLLRHASRIHDEPQHAFFRASPEPGTLALGCSGICNRKTFRPK